jgi:hypothetical protein
VPSQRCRGAESGLLRYQVDAVVGSLKQFLRPPQPLLVQPAERVGADPLAKVALQRSGLR